MESLSNQQLVLLALLISFVTSLATGIVTVSLMDQAPQGVVRTINQVVERTIQQVSTPQEAAAGAATAISVSVTDQVADMVSSVSGGVVKIKDRSSDRVSGLGLVVSRDGVVLTDKEAIAGFSDYAAVLADGRVLPMAVVQSQDGGDIVFLKMFPQPRVPGAAIAPEDAVFATVAFADSYKLGQAALAVSGTSTAILGQGIVDEIDREGGATSTPTSIGTSIPLSKTVLGSPLFDVTGKVLGMRTNSLSTGTTASFYLLKSLQAVIPSFK